MLSRLLRASEASGPVLISSSTASLSSAATISLAAPTSILEGDILIAFLNAQATSALSWSGPGGGAPFTSRYNGGTGYAVFTRVATNTDQGGGGSYTFQPSAVDNISGVLLVFRNASYDTIGSPGNANPVVAPSITLTNDKSYVIAYYRESGSSNYSTPTNFNPLVSDNGIPAYATFGKSVDAGATGTVESTGSGGTGFGILVGLGPL